MSPNETRTIYQPLHFSVRPRLDPEYVTYHNTVLQYLPADDTRPWTPSFRTRANITTTKPVPVDDVRDISIPAQSDDDTSHLQARVFTPNPTRPAGGWPLLLWFHGGGFVLGGLDSENDLCALLCRTARCVVVTIGYRLAPEHPYPAALQDSLRALRWVASNEGSGELRIDRDRIAVGGTSAGGSLAASVVLHATSQQTPLAASPIRITHQLLLLPVLDHTATLASATWRQRPHAPWLTPARILWYRGLYFDQRSPVPSPSQSGSSFRPLPSSRAPSSWQASPALASDDMLRRLPPTWVAVAGEDVLRGEAEDFVDRLKGLEVPVQLKCYEGVGHSVLALCGILTKGKHLMYDAAEELRRAFPGEVRVSETFDPM